MQSQSYHIKNLDHLGLVSGMCKYLGISEIIDKHLTKDRSNKVTYGQAVVAMVLNAMGFHSQTLHMFPKFYEDKPTERLIGPGVLPEHLNDDVLGRCLDALYDFGVSELFQTLAESTLDKLKLSSDAVHLDISSFHTDGADKDSPDTNAVSIVKGYSRDHRPELNQVVLELLCESQAGIPIHMRALSGNANDQKSFAKTVSHHLKSLKAAQHNPYLVADAALYTKETIQTLNAQDRKFVSRVPATLKEAKEAIANADCDNFEIINQDYSAMWLESHYADVPQRWLLICSRQAKNRELATFEKNKVKTEKLEQKQLDKLCKQRFACREDAERALEAFSKTLTVTRVIDQQYEQQAVYNQKGRPKKGQLPDKYEYTITANLEVDEKKVSALQQPLGLFIIATNDCQTELSKQELLNLYKSQQKVERGFRFLKSPEFMTSSLYLKKPERIEALLMVMTLSLLIYAALEHEVRTQLKAHSAYFPDLKNKDCQNPTARWVFICFKGIHQLQVGNSPPMIIGLTDKQMEIIKILGKSYEEIYS